jgi:hypothetical protein
MPTERFDFLNAAGQKLAALRCSIGRAVRIVRWLYSRIVLPAARDRAVRHIAEGLKLHGIAVLRLDFTGLGASEGEFANTTVSSKLKIWSQQRSSATDARGAGPPDRSQSRRRRRACRSSPHPRGAGSRNYRSAIRSSVISRSPAR